MDKKLKIFVIPFFLLFSLGAGIHSVNKPEQPKSNSSKQVEETKESKEDVKDVVKEETDDKEEEDEYNFEEIEIPSVQKKAEKVEEKKENGITDEATNLPIRKKDPDNSMTDTLLPFKKTKTPQKDPNKQRFCFVIQLRMGLTYVGVAGKKTINLYLRNVKNKEGDSGDRKEITEEFCLKLEEYLDSLYRPQEGMFLYSFSIEFVTYESEDDQQNRLQSAQNQSPYEEQFLYPDDHNYPELYYYDFHVIKGEDLLLSEDNFYDNGRLENDLWDSNPDLIEAVTMSVEDTINIFVVDKLPEGALAITPLKPQLYIAVDDDADFELYARELTHFVKGKSLLVLADTTNSSYFRDQRRKEIKWVLFDSCK